MARYIDADAMRQEWLENGENEYVYDTNAVLDSIDQQPTIEARPVVRGEWDEDKYSFCNYCTQCGLIIERGCIKWKTGELNYCPNCGADLRTKEEVNG